MKELKKLLYHSYEQNGLYEVVFECEEGSVRQIGEPVFIPAKEIGARFGANHAIPAEGQSAKTECKGCTNNIFKRWINGGLGIIKSELGINAATEETYQHRKSICLDCPSKDYDFGVCNACGCFLAAKLTIRGESCPNKYWGPEQS